MNDSAEQTVSIRSFRKQDAPACRTLYSEAMLTGSVADNDTGADIDHIEAAYMRSPGSHFWVAETPGGEVVGMLGVQSPEEGLAEIRRLRVRQDHRRRGIGSALLEAALRFCQEQGHLKITLDTYIDREPAIRLFEKFRFKHSRSKTVHGKELLFFFLDVYGREKRRS